MRASQSLRAARACCEWGVPAAVAERDPERCPPRPGVRACQSVLERFAGEGVADPVKLAASLSRHTRLVASEQWRQQCEQWFSWGDPSEGLDRRAAHRRQLLLVQERGQTIGVWV